MLIYHEKKTSRADVVRMCAERYDSKFNVKLGRFRSQLQVSYVSSHNEEFWYNETFCLWMIIYTLPNEFERSGVEIYGCHLHKAKPLEWIEHFGIS